MLSEEHRRKAHCFSFLPFPDTPQHPIHILHSFSWPFKTHTRQINRTIPPASPTASLSTHRFPPYRSARSPSRFFLSLASLASSFTLRCHSAFMASRDWPSLWAFLPDQIMYMQPSRVATPIQMLILILALLRARSRVSWLLTVKISG